jgi:hypothetical protein
MKLTNDQMVEVGQLARNMAWGYYHAAKDDNPKSPHNCPTCMSYSRKLLKILCPDFHLDD